MNKEEQLAFMASRDKQFEGMQRALTRIEDTFNKPAKANTVKPNYEPAIAMSLIGRSLKNCRHCGYGYFVNNIDRLYGLSLMMGKATLTCPSCGHVEARN